MKALWSWADKKHPVKLAPRTDNRIRFVDDKTGATHYGGTVDHETGVLSDAQLYFDLSPGCPGVTVWFVRIYADGRPDDATGYQDFPRIVGDAHLSIAPKWSGQMDDSFRLELRERHLRGYARLYTAIYKGWE